MTLVTNIKIMKKNSSPNNRLARNWFVILMVLMICFPFPNLAKTSIYFVAGSTAKAGKDQEVILKQIAKGFSSGLGEMWAGTMNFKTWKDSDSRKSLLEEQPINYVLMLDKWIANEANNTFTLYFKLKLIKKGYLTEDVPWMNNDYLLKLHGNQPIYLTKVVEGVCTDIDLYIESSDNPSKRKFRPRIKIDPFDIELNDITKLEFSKWLNEELNSKYALGEKKYVFYYSSNKVKIYPETSLYTISGSIHKSQNNGGSLIEVIFIFEFPPHYEDEVEVALQPSKFKDENSRKKLLVSNIDDTFNDKIQYYEGK